MPRFVLFIICFLSNYIPNESRPQNARLLLNQAM